MPTPFRESYLKVTGLAKEGIQRNSSQFEIEICLLSLTMKENYRDHVKFSIFNFQQIFHQIEGPLRHKKRILENVLCSRA